ncbi:hypothetical protein ACHQM5_005695 [Ranunculus cassubicifolius]
MKYAFFGDRLIPTGNVPLKNQWETFKILPEEDVLELINEVEQAEEAKHRAKQRRRNWLELPEDLISLIFTKIGPIQILHRAQFVCSLWQKLSKQPHLFRSLDLRKPFIHNYYFNYKKLANVAIDRSSGELVELYVENFGTEDLLRKVADKSVSLKYLCLVACHEISDTMFIEFVRKSPSLEQLEMVNCYFPKEVIAEIGTCCSQLKKFRLDYFGDERNRLSSGNEEAFAIAKNMPGLHSLHLFGNDMTCEGLDAILDGCTHLEYLDLRRCCEIDFDSDDDEMKKKCVERVKHVRLPWDSMAEYDRYSYDGFSDCYSYVYSGRWSYSSYGFYEDEEPDYIHDNSDTSGKKDKDTDYGFHDDYEILKFLPAKVATCYF